MKDEFKTVVFLFLTRECAETGKTQVLLQLRQGTGYMDGKYDLAASGHVIPGESMRHAIQREAEEEIGISIPLETLDFCLFIDAPEEGYHKGIFSTEMYTGEPKVREPNKCGGLLWADIDNLPDNIIPYLPVAINIIRGGGRLTCCQVPYIKNTQTFCPSSTGGIFYGTGI